ncbi:MAG: hypothetical protein WEC37_02235 [Anaerolineales bacterium]
MKEFEITLPSRATDAEIILAVDTAARELGLTQVSKGSLGLYPGSTHWHYKLGSQSGTLEITFWPKERRAWFALRANRYARWMDAVVPQLKTDIERWLIANPSEVRA